MGGVDQAVERALGEYGVGEERVPLLWRAVARDDGRASAHALADQLVQILALTFCEGAQAEVVADEQVRYQVAAQASLGGAVEVSGPEVGQEPAGLLEEHRSPLHTGRVSDGLGEVGLADAHRADQEHRLLARDEAAGGEVADLDRGDLGVEGEVEIGERLHLVEARALEAAREGLVLTALRPAA